MVPLLCLGACYHLCFHPCWEISGLRPFLIALTIKKKKFCVFALFFFWFSVAMLVALALRDVPALVAGGDVLFSVQPSVSQSNR